MKRRPKKKRTRPLRVISLWSFAQANKVLPYLRSVTSSLREHWLEAMSKKHQQERLAARPGRPDRAYLLANEMASKDQSLAEERFVEALQELVEIDVYLLDPVQGVALIPFTKDDELAWFVFDLFEEGGELKTWRFHKDPLEMRRPIGEALIESKPTPPSEANPSAN